MSGRVHNRDCFYKYTTCDTAALAIENRTFKWSSPIIFNDPFDHQAGFELKIDKTEFAKLMTASIERLIFGEAEPTPSGDSLFNKLTLMLRPIRHQLPREQILRELAQSSIESAAIMEESFSKMNAAVETQLCASRVFCVTESPSNLVMWSHYANEHRGVVFKLRCIDEIDNRLLAARKVEYTDQFLQFPSAQDYAMHLTGEKPFDLIPLVWKLAFTKHRAWSYEEEWRVHVPLLDQDNGEGFSIWDEDPQVFDSIYLGCRISRLDAERIISLTKRKMPHVKIFRAVKSKKSFAIDFEAIE